MKTKDIDDLIKIVEVISQINIPNYIISIDSDEIIKTLEDVKLILPDVVSSYVILYNNGDYEHFDGEITKAIEHLKEDSRYSNYGHNGAVLFKGKKVYSITDERTETFFT